MKKLLIILLLCTVSLTAKNNFNKSFKTVQKALNSIEKQLISYAEKNKAYEVANLATLIRTHINLMAAGTTALAPQLASRELEIKKHLNSASKNLFTSISQKAHELNPPSKLMGDSTISFESETYLAGVITLLRQQLQKLYQSQKKELLPTKKTDKASVIKLHKEGLKVVKTQGAKLSKNDKELIKNNSGLIDTYKKFAHAKAQRGSMGPAGRKELTKKINAAANREIELFMHLSNDAKRFFKQIRSYAKKINDSDTFMGGLSPRVIAFLDDVKKKL